MGVLTAIFAIALAGIVADTIAKVTKARHGGEAVKRLQAEVADLRRQLAEQDVALRDTQSALLSQDTVVQDLVERLDFAERLLSNAPARPGLSARSGDPN